MSALYAGEPTTILTWAANAAPGEVYEYAVGNLAKLRDDYRIARLRDQLLPAEEMRQLGDGQDAWALHERDAVCLMQRRDDGGVLRYIAVKRRAR